MVIPWGAIINLGPSKEKFTRAELVRFNGQDGLEIKDRLILFADELESLAIHMRDIANKLG